MAIHTDIDTGLGCRLEWLADDLARDEKLANKSKPYQELDEYDMAEWGRKHFKGNPEYMSSFDYIDICIPAEYDKDPMPYYECREEARKEIRKGVTYLRKAAEFLKRLEKWQGGDIDERGFVKERYW